MELNPRVPSGPIAEAWDRHRFDLKLVNPANKRKYSVIVVGSGLAGSYGTLTVNANGSYSYALDNSNASVAAFPIRYSRLRSGETTSASNTPSPFSRKSIPAMK